jgi:hypothetical protein
MRRSRIAVLTVIAAVAASGALAASAGAAFHLVKVREVHNGPAITGDYVMIQMYEPGQNVFGGHYLRFLDSAGGVLAEYPLNNAANGETQRTYLLGNSVANADKNEAGVNVQESGAVCYNELNLGLGGIDCVSWGAFTGATSSLVGNPAVPGGLAPGQSLVRTIARGCATALDVADDTDNSAADFAVGPPIARNNATAPTEKLCTPKKKKCKKKKKKGKAGASAKKKKKCKKKKKK